LHFTFTLNMVEFYMSCLLGSEFEGSMYHYCYLYNNIDYLS